MSLADTEPEPGARLMYCHGLDRPDQELVLERRVGEAPRVSDPGRLADALNGLTS